MTTKKLQEQVLTRDNWTCQVCGRWTDQVPHHIKFRSQGGQDEIENLVTLCFDCHYGFHGGCKYRGWVEDGVFRYEEIRR